jgi:hypothetical protein
MMLCRRACRARHSLLVACLCLLGCSAAHGATDAEDKDRGSGSGASSERSRSSRDYGLQWVVLDPMETEKEASCVLIANDGVKVAGGSLVPLTASNYRLQQEAANGRASFRFFVRPDPGLEAQQPQGKLVLSVDFDGDNFGADSAGLGVFLTPDGAPHRVYFWGIDSCEEVGSGPPEWVLERLTQP